MHLDIQTFIGQLPIGALYALVSVGFVTIFRASRVFNLAQGGLALVGGYLSYTFSAQLGLSFVPAIILTMVVAALVGVVLYEVVFRPLFGQRPVLLLMVSLGLNLALTGLIILIWGTQTDFLTTPSWLAGVWSLGDHLTISRINGVLLLVTVVMLGGFALLVRFTRFGLSMRAASENPALANYRGLPLTMVAGVAWAIALAFGALAGVAYGASQGLTPASADVLGAAAFPAVVIGGIDSVAGALIGSFLLAEVQGFTTIYVGGAVSEVAGYLLLLVFLVVRPTGLFGRHEIARL